MKAELVERQEVYVQCPGCGDKSSHRVTDLRMGVRFGISYCGKCGVGIEGYKTDAGVEIRVADEGEEVNYILLRVHPEETPMFLIVSPAGAEDYGIGPAIDLRQIVAVRYDDHLETLRSIKYAIQPYSKKPSATEE